MDCRWRTGKQNIWLRVAMQCGKVDRKKSVVVRRSQELVVRCSRFAGFWRGSCQPADERSCQRLATNDQIESAHAPRPDWTDGRCCCFGGGVSDHGAARAVVRADVCGGDAREQTNRSDLR